MDPGQTRLDTAACNVCGGYHRDHHAVETIETVYGANVWVYADGYIHVVPWISCRNGWFVDPPHAAGER